MSDNPQARIEVSETDQPERCANCNYFARARYGYSTNLLPQLFVMGFCIAQRVEVLPEAVCRQFKRDHV